MDHGQDTLEMLLPDVHPRQRDVARRVTLFLRLLSNDAGATSASCGVDAARAGLELEQQGQRAVRAALEDLLRSHLNAALGPDDFAWMGAPRSDYENAWEQLDGLRRESPSRAGVPRPGESAVQVATRLLRCLAEAGADPARVGWWQARLERATTGATAAEPALRAACEALAADEGCAAEARADVAACLLDRGAPRACIEWLGGEGPMGDGRSGEAHVTGRVRQLLECARWALGARVGGDVLAGPGPLPRGFEQVCEERGLVLPRRVLNGERSAAAVGPVRDRSFFGASTLAVFRFRGGLEPLALDVAPALGERVHAWLDELDGRWTVAGSAEQRLVLQARPVREHAEGTECLRGALDATARARALAPVRGEDGEVAGWLYLECAHHLLPATPRLESWARAWRNALLAPPELDDEARSPALRPVSHGVSVGGRGVEDARSERDARTRTFADVVAALGIKTAHRRWSGFEVDGEQWRLVAQGGKGLADTREAAGGARALGRALATGGSVRLVEPDPRLSFHRAAASGVFVPVVLLGRPVALLALESARRNDFKTADVERIEAMLGAAALSLRVASFRAWHERRFGRDLAFPCADADFACFAERLIAVARTDQPVVVSGPAGVGKRTFARWLHFESSRAEEPLPQRRGSDPGRGQDLGERGEGNFVLDAFEELAPEQQAAWLAFLEGRDRRCGLPPFPRIFATTRTGAADRDRSDGLHDALLRRLERYELCVPALARRRAEIPALVAFLLERAAQELALEPPHLGEDVLAALWRQDWEGNTRELDNTLHQLALAHPGEAVGTAELASLEGALGRSFRKRLSSRRPRREDVDAALFTTRTAGGRANKRRAASLLGWDRDTLLARMRDMGLPESVPGAPRVWLPAPPGGGEVP